MANMLKATLQKKLGEVIYELVVKTRANMVYIDDATTLDTTLQTITQDISDAKAQLQELVGGASGSITEQIETAVNNLRDSLTNESDAESLAGKIKALNEAVNAINDVSTGILAEAKKYTDETKNSIISELSGAFHFRGSVDYVDQLPSEAVEEGYIYQVKYKGTSAEAGSVRLDAEYAWNGTEYVELGSIVDLTAYSTTEQMTSAISTAKEEAISTSAQSLQTAVNEINTTMSQKARFIVSAEQPGDLTESDVWCQVIEDVTTT